MTSRLSRRVKHLEEKFGIKREHYVLVIRCTDPAAESLQSKEILPGVYAFPYDGALSSEELEQLREKHGHHGES
jgi:hypothetical protein